MKRTLVRITESDIRRMVMETICEMENEGKIKDFLEKYKNGLISGGAGLATALAVMAGGKVGPNQDEINGKITLPPEQIEMMKQDKAKKHEQDSIKIAKFVEPYMKSMGGNATNEGKRRLVRITESDLHRLIMNSVRRYLAEG